MSLCVPQIRAVNGRESDFLTMNKIGRGGFASVYKCKHKIDGNSYALKKIQIDPLAHEQSELLNVEDEVRQLSSLNNPHIVRYFGCWVSDENVGDESKEQTTNKDFTNSKYHSIESCSKSNDLGSSCGSPANNWLSNEESYSIISLDESDSKKRAYNSKSKQRNTDIDNNSFKILILEVSQNQESEKENICHSKTKLERLRIPMDRPSKSSSLATQPKTSRALFIQMELCKMTLREFIQNRNKNVKGDKLNIEQKLESFRLCKQLLQALIYLKEQRVIHRDIKPSNIFIGNDERLKLGDFGLVKQIEDIALEPSPMQSPLTKTISTNDEIICDWELHSELPSLSLEMERVFSMEQKIDSIPADSPKIKSLKDLRQYELTRNIGTKLYASPEQISSSFYSYETDHFSAGLIILELLLPTYTEMHRVKMLTNAREGKIPKEIGEQYEHISNGLSLLLDTEPHRRIEPQDLITLITKEELKLRKSSKYSMQVEFRKESEDQTSLCQVVIQKSSLLIFTTPKANKADIVYDLKRFSTKRVGDIVELQSDIIQGCTIQFVSSFQAEQFEKMIRRRTTI